MSQNQSLIRKQLYIRSDQDRALKQAAREQGRSEAELVRQAIDEVILRKATSPSLTPHQQALEELIQTNIDLSRQSTASESYQFNRDDIYREREARWS